MTFDPVCNKEVTDDISPLTSQYKGMTYYFCTLECKKRFVVNPERYCFSPPEIPVSLEIGNR